MAQAVAFGGLYLTALGLFGLGIAAIVRHTAGATTTYVSVVLIVPEIVRLLPASIGDSIGKYLPANIGIRLRPRRGGGPQRPARHG
jgi:hypothetical protein